MTQDWQEQGKPAAGTLLYHGHLCQALLHPLGPPPRCSLIPSDQRWPRKSLKSPYQQSGSCKSLLWPMLATQVMSLALNGDQEHQTVRYTDANTAAGSLAGSGVSLGPTLGALVQTLSQQQE